jgi:NAD(P)-dependent dehydrogenase (short-subunit alcohol dehydrogenase family)
VSKAVALVAERFGGLDGLVLNAGVIAPGGVSACPGWTITEMADAEMAAFGRFPRPVGSRGLPGGDRAGTG